MLLDEPTAGVDAKARREFWDLIHDMAVDGLTTLVSTHYMDEAERCKRIVYLAQGRIVVQGGAASVVEQSGLVTFEGTGDDVDRAAVALRQTPGVEAAAVFGRALRVASLDRRGAEAGDRDERRGTRLDGSRAAARRRFHPYAERAGGANVNGFSFARLVALLRKERSRSCATAMTLRIIIAIPLMQLFLFGYRDQFRPEAPAGGPPVDR